jgi:hypothetical protein
MGSLPTVGNECLVAIDDIGDAWVTAWIGPDGAGGGYDVFYLATSDPSDIATYKTALTSPSAGVEQTVATACTTAGVDYLVGIFATDPGIPGAVDFPAGTAFRRIYASVNAGAALFHVQIYKRDIAGTETLIRDEFSANFSDTVVTVQEWAATMASAGTLLGTDRLVVKLYAQRVGTGGGSSITVTTYFEGTLHASQIQTTIAAGAQGPTGPKGDTGYDTAPIGTALSWSRKTLPEGYVLGDGASYTQALYPQGYAVAVAEVAAGNPLWTANTTAHTFTVPNLTDKFIYSRAPANMGATGGEATHLLTASESGLYPHYHYMDQGAGAGAGNGSYPASGNNYPGNSSTGPPAVSGLGVLASGKSADAAHNNLPPYVALAQIIKVAGVTASGGVIQGPPGPAIPVVAALPGAPIDGAEVYLIADAERRWHLRYESATSRWRMLGGSKLTSGPLGAISTNTTTPTAPGGGPALTVPFAGAYRLEFGFYADIQEFNTGVLQIQAAIYSGGAIVSSLARAILTSRGGGGGATIDGPKIDPLTLTAGQVLDFRFYGNVAGHTYYGQDFWLALMPIYLT